LILASKGSIPTIIVPYLRSYSEHICYLPINRVQELLLFLLLQPTLVKLLTFKLETTIIKKRLVGITILEKKG